MPLVGLKNIQKDYKSALNVGTEREREREREKVCIECVWRGVFGWKRLVSNGEVENRKRWVKSVGGTEVLLMPLYGHRWLAGNVSNQNRHLQNSCSSRVLTITTAETNNVCVCVCVCVRERVRAG